MGEQGLTWVGTSWKMTKTLSEARAFVDEVSGLTVPTGVQPFLLPAHTSLATVRERLPADSPILLGAQNAHWGPEGAGTGEISMRMVRDAGASLVEMGHSERREAFGETDETVAAKAIAALEHGLTPLICVGEPAVVRRDGWAEAFVTAQVRGALSRVPADRLNEVIVAYEPIWAIGVGGTPAAPGQIAPVMEAIVDCVERHGPPLRAVLYGGGVDPGNAAQVLADHNTDGLFVGRGGWAASDFTALIHLVGAFRRHDKG